jgi:hypothetical protein
MPLRGGYEAAPCTPARMRAFLLAAERRKSRAAARLNDGYQAKT